jgi:hypothetical protein
MRVAVLGERVRVEGYSLAGAVVYPADDPEEVRGAWGELPDDVAMVVLTPAAARALGLKTGPDPGLEPSASSESKPAASRSAPLTAVMPP